MNLEQQTEQIDDVSNLDSKAALALMNPVFWLISNALHLGLLYLAGSSMSELSLDQLAVVGIACHILNFSLQLASIQKRGLSGNVVANLFESKNPILNTVGTVVGYLPEALGRNADSVVNWLSHYGYFIDQYEVSVLVATQAIAGLATTGIANLAVSTGAYRPLALGIQRTMVKAEKICWKATDVVLNCDPVAEAATFMGEHIDPSTGLFVQ